MDTLTAAITYVEKLGFSIVPVVPGEKKAFGKWKEYQQRKPTLDELYEWYSPGSKAGIAIILGEVSGVVAVDDDVYSKVDSDPDLGAIRTPAVRTGNKLESFHRYFRWQPGLPGRIIYSEGVQLRSDGHYVVAPPSIHPSGDPYQFLPSQSFDDVDLAPIPQFFLAKAWKDRQQKSAPVAHGSGERMFTAGGRHDALLSMGGAMRRQGATEEEIYVALDVMNQTRCIPPKPDEEVRELAHDIFDRYALEAILGKREEIPAKTGRFTPLERNAEVKPTEWVLERFVPAHLLTLVLGPTGSGKSMWGMWACGQASLAGFNAAYFARDTDEATERRRWSQVDQDESKFHLYYEPIDLMRDADLQDLVGELKAREIDMAFFDSVSKFTMPPRDPKVINAFYQNAFERWQLLRDHTGAAILPVDHTGFGGDHARDSSAKEQLVDASLLFTTTGERQAWIAGKKKQRVPDLVGYCRYQIIDRLDEPPVAQDGDTAVYKIDFLLQEMR